MTEKRRVLFICLGNICRSPIAEAVFADLVKKRGIESKWEYDSAAIIDMHVGRRADSRALEILARNNIDYKSTARQVVLEDFQNFDFIFGMDEDNIKDLNRLVKRKNCKAKIGLLGELDPNGNRIVRDPYYDNDKKGFEQVFDQCLKCCNIFLDQFN